MPHDETTVIIATIAATIIASPIDLSNLIIIIRVLRSLMSSSIVYGFAYGVRYLPYKEKQKVTNKRQ